MVVDRVRDDAAPLVGTRSGTRRAADPAERSGRADHADRVFHALADPTRREILSLTLVTDHSVSDLARRYPMSFAAVQKHVAVLERAGLVSKRRHGREQRVHGETDALADARRLLDGIEGMWRARIERIGALLTPASTTAPPAPPDPIPQPDAPPRDASPTDAPPTDAPPTVAPPGTTPTQGGTA